MKEQQFNKIEKEDFEYILSKDIDLSILEDKTILIAGANSFIFSYLAKFFLYYNSTKAKKKINLSCLARDKEKANKKFSKHKDIEELKIIEQDVVSPIKHQGKADIIIHAASQASPHYYSKDPAGTINANLIGAFNLLNFAKDNGSNEFLFISSGEVYGKTDKEEISETDYGYIDCTDIRSCYSEGKRAAETMSICYGAQHNINVKIARLFHTYGPEMPTDDERVFADFSRAIKNRKNIEIKSSGTNVRSFCYVSDLIDGLLRILTKGQKNEAYNIANPKQSMSIAVLAEKLEKEFSDYGIKAVISKRDKTSNYLESPIKNSIPSIKKMELLNFNPEITVEKGFRKVIEWEKEEAKNSGNPT